MPAVQSLALTGTKSTTIDVECYISRGLPALVIVGLASRALTEARERLRVAFAASKLPLPPRRITLNLAPADIPKNTTAYDLALAVSIMQSRDMINHLPPDTLFFGELALDGSLKPIRGLIGLLVAAKQAGFGHFYIPEANLRQASLVPGITLLAVPSLRDAYLALSGMKVIEPVITGGGIQPDLASPNTDIDLTDIAGQATAKQALAIAAAGAHNLLLIGPPGLGKTMLARALPGLLPPMSIDEILQVSHLHSLAENSYDDLVLQRPVRSPHHSISLSGLLGGGQPPKPGEISLSHGGILQLDELPLFKTSVLEALRQPLEQHQVSLGRANQPTSYPAAFQLLATANPCPCGYLGSRRPCRCSALQVLRYNQRLSGPLLDRIDLHVTVEDVDYGHVLSADRGTSDSSRAIGRRVELARDRQFARGQTCPNAHLTNQQLNQFLLLSASAKRLIERSATALKLSVRSYLRVLKVSRTIADLEGCHQTTNEHISQALQFRPTDELMQTDP